MIEYTIVENERGQKCIIAKGDDYEMVIPMDPANADYQRYLNPEAEQSTPILPE